MTKTQKRAIATGETLADFYPEGVNWNALNICDLQSKNVADLIKEGLQRNPDGTAVNFMGKKINYAAFDKLVDRAALGLQGLGVKKGDRVGIFMPNTPAALIMFMGILRAGGVAVQYSPLYKEDELATQIEDSDTGIMVTINLNDFFDKATSLQKQGKLIEVIKCDLEDMMSAPKKLAFRTLMSHMVRADNEDCVNLNNLLNNDGNYEPIEACGNDTAMLQYTSGSTGTPKGVMLSHFNLVANSTQICEFFGTSPDKPKNATTISYGKERILAVAPYSHVYGMMTGIVNALHMGNEILPVIDARDIGGTLKLIDKEKPTIAPLVPRLIQAYAEHPQTAFKAYRVLRKKNNVLKAAFKAATTYPLFRQFNLKSIKGVVSGGAALASAVAEAFEKLVGKKNIIIQGYGLSETSPVAASNPGNGLNDVKTVGLPYPGTTITIVDPNDPTHVLNIGETGEICISGPQVFSGYHKKPEETAKVLTKGGTFLTGDLGHMREDFYTQITDRKKRIVIVNGENISPARIEEEVFKHPSISECAVIGLPDKSAGETTMLIIRFKDDVPRPSESKLRAFLSENLSRAEMPKYIKVSEEELPMINGKTDWKTLQDVERAKLLEDSENKPTAQELKPN